MLQGEKIEVRRSVGKLANLQKSLKEKELKGTVGIGHTRWATHGKPSEQNAHPHRSKGCVLVHNGIIENYQPLKQQLEKEGYKFHSETDTEVVAHLIDKYLEPKEHYDIETLPAERAAEMGPLMQQIERAMRSVGDIGRVHIGRWGEGSEHLHWWFMGRPARMRQLSDSFAAIWDDILPPVPEEIWQQNVEVVRRELSR